MSAEGGERQSDLGGGWGGPRSKPQLSSVTQFRILCFLFFKFLLVFFFSLLVVVGSFFIVFFLSSFLSFSFFLPVFSGPPLHHMEAPGARGRIGATAASLHHSHSHMGSEPHL